LGVPLRNGGETVASLIAVDPSLWRSSEPMSAPPWKKPGDLKAFLKGIATLLEDRWLSLKEMEKMAEELSQQLEDIYLYSRLSTEIKTLRFSHSMLEELNQKLQELMHTDLAFAKLPDRTEYNALAVRSTISEKLPDPKCFVDTLIRAIPQTASSLKESYFVVNDSRDIPGFSRFHPDPFRFLAVMIRHEEAFYGWLGLLSFNLKEIFRRSELRLLISVAEQVAVVISNTDLYRDLEQFVINVVKSLVYAIEAKDEYTRGHSERVSHYCMEMAERLDLDEDQKRDLQWASILHDVGKIGIPEAILNKAGKLESEEYAIIKEHPRKGYHILRPLDQLAGSLPGILHHHERYDGLGYPSGLKGEEIPLNARIIAIADTFDAIHSSRAYRPAGSREQALAIVREAAGIQLDPYLVEVFFQVVSRDPTEEKHGQGT